MRSAMDMLASSVSSLVLRSVSRSGVKSLPDGGWSLIDLGDPEPDETGDGVPEKKDSGDEDRFVKLMSLKFTNRLP